MYAFQFLTWVKNSTFIYQAGLEGLSVADFK